MKEKISQISLQTELNQMQKTWTKNLLFWIIELYQIYKSEDIETVALKNFNLKIFRGEFLGLIGPSGSGKSSLLKVLAGLIPCTTGRIYFCPNMDDKLQNISRYSLQERTLYRKENIGYISQDPIVFDYLSVEENIEVPLLIKNQKPQDKIDEINLLLNECGIEHKRASKVKHLSGGEKQRLQIIMALITKPELILADEPTANLDSKNAALIFDLLKTFNKKFSTTILTVTHDNLISDFTNRILTIKDGQILENKME